MKVIEDYIKYFKHQAEQHPELLHSDVSGSRVFQVIDVEEAFGDFRTAVKEKDFIMRLLWPFWTLTDNYSDSRVSIQGGVLIAKYHGNRKEGSPEFISAMSESAIICHDIAEKMVADSQNNYPLFYESIRSVQHLNWNAQPAPFVGDTNYSGYICTFSFDNHMRNCLEEHEDDTWKTLTPHEL